MRSRIYQNRTFLLEIGLGIILSVLTWNLAYAQSLSQHVLGTVGNAHPRLSYTVGEVAIRTGQSGRFILTQGFHQTENQAVANDPRIILTDYHLYPNPTTQALHLRLSSLMPVAWCLQVVDMAGKQVFIQQEYPPQRALAAELDVSGLAAGGYLLQISSQRGHPAKTLRFARVH